MKIENNKRGWQKETEKKTFLFASINRCAQHYNLIEKEKNIDKLTN